MISTNVIISIYPLTTTYIARISELVGGGRQIVLSNITAKGYFDILCLIRKIEADHIYFPITDTIQQSLIPLFKVLGMISSSRKNFIVMPDFSIKQLGPGSGMAGLLEILYNINISSWELLKYWFLMRSLLNFPRIKVSENPSKHILYLKHTLWLGLQAGGSIAHTRGVIKGFLAGGWKVDLLTFDSRLEITGKTGFRALELNSPSPYIVPRALNFSQFNRNVLDALKSLPFQPFRVIYQRLSPGNFSGVILSRLRKIPLIIEYNGSENWLAKNWGSGISLSSFVEKAESVSLKHAHLIVTVSDVLKDELIERGIEPDRIISCPNGVDPEEFHSEKFSNTEIGELRNDLDVPEEAILLTFVGTFGHWHGVDFLAKLLTEQANNNPEWFEKLNLYVCFVGDGIKRSSVDEMIAKCALGNRFKLTGLVPQQMTPLYMAASDILVSPHIPNPDGSLFFGSPTKLFEYMASGRPIIASDLSQIGEVLEGSPHARKLPSPGLIASQEECGILVEPESKSDIIKAIQFLVENPDWRRAAGKNARERVISRYTWDRHTKEITRGLDKVLALHKQPARKPIKVLLNALHAKTGGGVTYLKNILPLLAENPNIELHICLHEDQVNVLPKMDEDFHLYTFGFKTGFLRLPFWEQVLVPRLARKIGADVTFSPANYGPIFASNHVIMLRNALGVAFVERRPTKLVYWLLVSIGTLISLLTCRKVIAVSKYALKSNFNIISGFLRDRFSIVPHGVSDAYKQNANGSHRQDYLLAVSDVYVQKNLKNLIMAVALLRLEKPDIVLKIAGRFVDKNYYLELKTIICKNGLEANIQFLGGVYEDELVDLYLHCAVFVFPSIIETFGNPLIEAMASGAPIATSNTAAMPEVAGDAALYFDPYNVEEMATCIGRLMVDEKLRENLSEKALARSQNYSWEKTAESTIDILYLAAREATE